MPSVNSASAPNAGVVDEKRVLVDAAQHVEVPVVMGARETDRTVHEQSLVVARANYGPWRSVWEAERTRCTTGNVTLAGLQVIDGVQLQVGDRVLVSSQNNEDENGIYVAKAGNWTRALDLIAAADVASGMKRSGESSIRQEERLTNLTAIMFDP